LSAAALFRLPDGRLRAPWRLAGFFLIAFAVAAALGALALSLVPRDPLLQGMLFSLTACVAFAVAHAVMLRLVDRLPWSYAGLDRAAASPGRLSLGAWLGALAIGLPSVALLATGLLDSIATPGGAGEWLRWAGVMALFLLPAALWEELLFRGYPFAVLRGAIGTPWALALTSALFGIVHVQNPSAAALPLVLVALAGVFLGVVLLATRSLWAAWLAHFAWNWVMAALLHTDVSGVLPGLPPAYRVLDGGPDWITGGGWGPEGGVGAGLGMCAGLVYLIARRGRSALFRGHAADAPPPGLSGDTG
jgi:membrane protease YdiL (CAAX protease family)